MRKVLILQMLVLLLFVQQSAPLAAATRVFLCSRLEFTPALLDMLRRSFARRLSLNDTIILQPVENTGNLSREASGSLILVEHGMDTSLLPEGYRKSNAHIDLVWALVASLRIPGLPIDQAVDGERFVVLLRELKKQSPDSYPWFEALSSKVTLRNFDVLFAGIAGQKDAGQAPASATEKPFWQESDSIIYLYRAIEEHLLNPFSIEADLGLAMNVFEADDAMFVSQWIPAEFLDDERLCRENLGKVRLLPFPVLGNSRYPRIRLCLYSQATVASASYQEDAGAVPDERFIDLDYIADMEWIEKKSSDRYDALIIGGF
ncbi:MAG: hypothetical protein CVV42_03185 [Candidatus Riflebacteria bacterium HGW-Riflebacteria-2]|jgi:hypothetical protein|nr:MAG: hypothetical protein CVV42_03185 [Candidatus Riflebacteria bacterium HGW-Riflebacteria-2]